VVPALRRLAAATLRDRDRGDAAVHAHGHIAVAEEAAICAVARDVPPQPMAKMTDEQRASLQMLAASAPGHSLSTLLVRG
jgi:hypothetical protein